MKRWALCLVTGALACADADPTSPLLPPAASLACDIELTAGVREDATGSVTLEVLVVSVTPAP